MKERIYTIALNDAIGEKCGCALCTLEKKLEEDAAAYFLGPSLMEPDGRQLTNEKGFCRRHMNMLLGGGNRLGLALTLETHLKELADGLSVKIKRGLTGASVDFDACSEELYSHFRSCALCDKLNGQMSAAAENMVFLIENEQEFREKFEASGGLCLEHFALMVQASRKELSGKKAEKFVSYLYELQKKELSELNELVHEFTLSFDYRSAGKPLSEEAAQSVEKAVKILTKF